MTPVVAGIGSLVMAEAKKYVDQPSFSHGKFSTHTHFPEVDNLPRNLEVEGFLRRTTGLNWTNNYYAYWTEAHYSYQEIGGFDCSLLVGQAIKDAFIKSGINADVPRHATELYAWPLTTFTRMESASEGSLIFLRMSPSRNPTSHVGIYDGNGKVIHSPGVDDAKVEIISLERFIYGSDERMATAKRLIL